MVNFFLIDLNSNMFHPSRPAKAGLASAAVHQPNMAARRPAEKKPSAAKISNEILLY
jgi:hypothetical protein